MNQQSLLEAIKKPGFFGPSVDTINLIQTHISYVALTGEYAYKIKKPVNFGFLDFSTLDKRKYYCEEELRLNKRLCPDIYLNVIPITQKKGKIELNGDGATIEYTLKMKEFPQNKIMTHLLQQKMITKTDINQICSILVNFYTHSKHHDPEIDSYGTISAVKKNIDENFEQTKDVINLTISSDTFEYIKQINDQFLTQKKTVFDKRISSGCIKDCHGDLHSGNIVIDNQNIYIFDCIEFNKRFRFCDVASDIGFLAMDLDYLNHPYLSSHLISQYVTKSNDTGTYSVLNFYKSYRAYVRGKVIGFRLQEPALTPQEKQNIIQTTQKYYELSAYYTSLISLDITNKNPLIFMVSGLTGTGKSTIALKLAVDYHAHLLNTDIIRKEEAGIDKFERHHDKIDTGLYSPQNVESTYETMLEKTKKYLQNGEHVVLDATFQKEKNREMVHQLAQQYNTHPIHVHCVCSDTIVKQRLDERVKQQSISDGRWEVYIKQKTTYEPITPSPTLIEFDTANETYEYRMKMFTTIRKLCGSE